MEMTASKTFIDSGYICRFPYIKGYMATFLLQSHPNMIAVISISLYRRQKKELVNLLSKKLKKITGEDILSTHLYWF